MLHRPYALYREHNFQFSTATAYSNDYTIQCQRMLLTGQGLCVLGTAPGFPNPRPLIESLEGSEYETSPNAVQRRLFPQWIVFS